MKKSSEKATKVSFGRRRTGKPRKTNGPKDGKVKKYKGQGR